VARPRVGRRPTRSRCPACALDLARCVLLMAFAIAGVLQYLLIFREEAGAWRRYYVGLGKLLEVAQGQDLATQ
jgi:hypothetical protein